MLLNFDEPMSSVFLPSCRRRVHTDIRIVNVADTFLVPVSLQGNSTTCPGNSAKFCHRANTVMAGKSLLRRCSSCNSVMAGKSLLRRCSSCNTVMAGKSLQRRCSSCNSVMAGKSLLRSCSCSSSIDCVRATEAAHSDVCFGCRRTTAVALPRGAREGARSLNPARDHPWDSCESETIFVGGGGGGCLTESGLFIS